MVLDKYSYKAIANVYEDDIDMISSYYELINEEKYCDIRMLYGNYLNGFVEEFFEDETNINRHEGLYNIKNAEVDYVREITDNNNSCIINNTEYDGVKKYFVKVDIQVYKSDKYYMEGVNYFQFTIGNENDGTKRILDIQIPSYKLIKEVDGNVLDVISYIEQRNIHIFGNVDNVDNNSRYTDVTSYVDVVANPSSIRVLDNGVVKTVGFYNYCVTVASREINTLTNIDGAKACAMAIKMFATHFVLTAASGANYDIDDVQQVYEEGMSIANIPLNAVNSVYDWYLIDSYGGVFKTFYRTQVSDCPEFCKAYGGILPQIEADSAGRAGISWTDILRTYYTRVSGVGYYNSCMNYGELIITSSHTHDWSYGDECMVCGAIAY